MPTVYLNGEGSNYVCDLSKKLDELLGTEVQVTMCNHMVRIVGVLRTTTHCDIKYYTVLTKDSYGFICFPPEQVMDLFEDDEADIQIVVSPPWAQA